MDWLAKLKFLLFTPEGLQQMIITWGYAALVGIVFSETGLMVGFFLPGDSLLFIAGFVAGMGHLKLGWLFVLLPAAALVGDSLGYWIGSKAGAAIYQREETRFFKKKHLLRTREFYEKHGGKTIILAKFVPIVRTFAPVVAGVAQMNYRRFLTFDVFGAFGWVISMTSLGYFLGSILWVQKNLEKMVLLVILLSLLPIFIEYWKSRRS